MRKVCLSLFMILGVSNSFATEQILTEQVKFSAQDEKLRAIEVFIEERHVYTDLCEHCRMPSNETLSEILGKSRLLGVPQSRVLEDILQVFHLNVAANVNYVTIESLSLRFEQEWASLSKEKSKKK